MKHLLKPIQTTDYNVLSFRSILADAEYFAMKVVDTGPEAIDQAVLILGNISDNSHCPETIVACEKLINMLNDQVMDYNDLTKEQAIFCATVMPAVCVCVTIKVWK